MIKETEGLWIVPLLCELQGESKDAVESLFKKSKSVEGV